MQNTALHSFVIPAYGASPWLEECLVSLRNQSVPTHIIVATSTPNDHIRSLCERFDLRLEVNDTAQAVAQDSGLAQDDAKQSTAENASSISADWNFAYQCASTPYVTLAHQDDVYDPHYVRDCLDSAAANPACSLVFSDYAELLCTQNSRSIRTTNAILVVKRIILFCFFGFGSSLRRRWTKHWLLAFGSPISCPTVMFHKSQLHNFQFSSDYSVNLDWDAWRRLAEEPGRFVYQRKRLVLHRIYAGSATTRGLHTQQRQREDATIFALFWPKPIARLFSRIYTLAYRSNEVESV